jgi:hypothetical protein
VKGTYDGKSARIGQCQGYQIEHWSSWLNHDFSSALVFRFSLARREEKKAKASAQGHSVDKSTGLKGSL